MAYQRIEEGINYNTETKLYRYRKTIDGKRKEYYAKTYEEIIQIKKKVNDLIEKRQKSIFKQK